MRNKKGQKLCGLLFILIFSLFTLQRTPHIFYEVNSASDVRGSYCFFGSENLLKLADILGKILFFF